MPSRMAGSLKVDFCYTGSSKESLWGLPDVQGRRGAPSQVAREEPELPIADEVVVGYFPVIISTNFDGIHVFI